jgi:AmiR/NasT family two-component response regulator
MEERVRDAYRELVEAVLTEPGFADTTLRRGAFDRAVELASADAPPGRFDEPLATLVDKVARHAYKVTDTDVRAVVESGLSEDAAFEVVVAASVGAGTARLDRGLATLREALARRSRVT